MAEHGRRAENETLDDLIEKIRSEEHVGAEVGAPLPELPEGDAGRGPAGEMPLRREVLRNVRLRVRVELGRTRMPLGRALGLDSGSLVELERHVDEPVEILIGDEPIARGQVLVVDDRFCVRITEVLAAGEGLIRPGGTDAP